MDISLTEKQKERMEEILSEYDAENMTKEDMESLKQDMEDAGIPRCRERTMLLRSSGFGSLERQEGKEQTSLLGRMQSQKGEIWDMYQQFQNGDITEEEFKAMIQSQIQSGSLINLIS